MDKIYYEKARQRLIQESIQMSFDFSDFPGESYKQVQEELTPSLFGA